VASVLVGEQNMTKAYDIAPRPKLMFLVTEDWYFVSHRLELAVAAREAGYDVIVATRVDRHGKRITDAGLTLRSVAFNRSGINPLKEFRTLVHLARLYRREAPDIVHHVALKPVIYGSLVARIMGTRGVVNALGGLGYVFFSAGFRAKVLRSIAGPVLRWLLNAENARLIVQNAYDEQRLVAAGVAKVSSIRVIRGSGVDPGAYRQVAVTSDMPLVVFPARFLREKGIIEFVGAARVLRQQGVKARFALVGRPDPANPTSVSQAEVDGWVGEGFVESWGWRDDMPAVFSQALPRRASKIPAGGCSERLCDCYNRYSRLSGDRAAGKDRMARTGTGHVGSCGRPASCDRTARSSTAIRHVRADAGCVGFFHKPRGRGNDCGIRTIDDPGYYRGFVIYAPWADPNFG
jgi:glycosyltransferase involved in cell wall biosynthesis